MKRLRWGVLGLGRHSSKKILPAFKETTSAELVAVGTSSRRQLSAVPAPAVTYEELIRASNIDAVFIALPNHLHALWSIKALEAGKHVLCEKPAVSSIAEASSIAETAQANSLRFAEAFMYRFHPQHKQVRQLLDAGTIGALKLIEVHFHYSLDDFTNIRLKADVGGGALNDVGCYGVDLASWFFGRAPSRVSATWERPRGEVDYHCFAQLIYGDGEAAHISAGCRFGKADHYTLYGTKGSLHLPSAFVMPRTKRGMIEVVADEKPKQILRTEPKNVFAKEIDAFSTMVLDNTYKDSGFGDYCLNAEVLAAIRLSAKESREIHLSSAA